MLQMEMARTGEWLFRRRSYLPLLMLPVVGAAFREFAYPRGAWHLHEWWELGCLLVSLLGVAVRALVVGYAPAGTSGRNTREGQVAADLNTTGAYAVVRHPLYLGNFLMWLGIALVPRSAWLVAVITLAYALYYERIMLAEEKFLQQRFGDAFEQWASRVPAIVPRRGRLRRAWRQPTVPFSWRTVLRREYSGVLAVAVLFAAEGTVANVAAGGRAGLHSVDTMDRTILLLGTTVYVLLRTLKRRTRSLAVPGR